MQGLACGISGTSTNQCGYKGTGRKVGNDSERATGMYISVCAHTHTPDVVRVSEVMVKTPAVSEEDGIHGGF